MSLISFNWLTVTPMPYFDDFFESMACDARFDFRVYYIAAKLEAYPYSGDNTSRADSVVLNGWGATSSFFRQIIFDRKKLWVVGGWGKPKYVIALIILAVLRRRFILFTDTPLVDGRSNSRIKQVARRKLLHWWFHSSKALMGTGTMALERLLVIGAPSQKLINWPYPLDEMRFNATQIDECESRLVIACSGRLSIADKRFDLALQAFARLLTVVPKSIELELRIAGTGPDGEALKALTRRLGINQHVVFCGWLSQRELCEFYGAARVYLHPADFEPYGVTVVEALYSGLFLVSSDGVASARELVDPGKNGYLFKAGSLESLVATLIEAVYTVSSSEVTKRSIRERSLRWPLRRQINEFVAIVERFQ